MATISDVAKLAGVSTSTVSRTCRDHPSISEPTKARVRKAMEQLGYEPNFQATNLVSRNSRTFGIILPPSDYETYQKTFYLEAIRGIGLFCNQRQYLNTILTAQTNDELLRTVQSMVRSGQSEGFIVLYSQPGNPLIDYFQNEGILHVLIGTSELSSDTIFVDNDNIQAGRELTSYLLAMGHEDIAFVSTEKEFRYSQDRKSGYLLALAERGLPVRQEYILEYSSIPVDDDAMYGLFKQEQRPTAIVAGDDILAVSLERVIFSMGLRIPEDVSIASFNDSLISRLTLPQLTSVNINSLQLGIEAASQIINHSENPDLLSTKIIVPHRIVERGSCSPPSDK